VLRSPGFILSLVEAHSHFVHLIDHPLVGSVQVLDLLVQILVLVNFFFEGVFQLLVLARQFQDLLLHLLKFRGVASRFLELAQLLHQLLVVLLVHTYHLRIESTL